MSSLKKSAARVKGSQENPAQCAQIKTETLSSGQADLQINETQFKYTNVGCN